MPIDSNGDYISEIEEAEVLLICEAHKTEFSPDSHCSGCSVERSYPKDKERAVLGAANTAEAIRARVLATLSTTNGMGDYGKTPIV